MKEISVIRKRLEVQGFRGYSDEELRCHHFGIRFAYAGCAALVLAGLILTNISILVVALIIALLGVVLKRHPFDYLYNGLIRQWMNRSPLPVRTPQVHFACSIASFWLIINIFLFYFEFFILGYIWGALLVAIASLVASTDICIPSMIYNFLFENNTQKSKQHDSVR